MAKNTKKRAVIYSNVKENQKLAEQRALLKDNQINLDDEIIIGINSNGSNVNSSTKSGIQNYRGKNNKKRRHRSPYKQPKAKMNPQTKGRIILFTKVSVVAAAFITGAVFALKSPGFNIKEVTVKVQNNTILTESQIKELSTIEVGQNLFSISKNNSINNIKSNSFVDSVKIKRKLPNKVEINVVERIVKFQLELDGNYIEVDNHGIVVNQSNEKKDGVIITGAKTQEFINGQAVNNDDLKGLSDVILMLQIAENNGVCKDITKIDISNHDDYKIYFEALGKMAHMGDTNSLNDKMVRVAKILELESNYEGEIFVNVDLNNKEYPYFRENV